MAMLQVILFIDDDQEDLDLFCEATGLIDPSIQRLTARNGLEALQMLQQTDALLPDLIFLDINMPVMNGAECLPELKKLDKLRNIPIVICSTSIYAGDQQQFDTLGADFYLVKPDTLINTVNALQFVFQKSECKEINRPFRQQRVA